MSNGIKIEELHGGEALELINAEIAQAIDNIRDPNTPIEKARTVTIKVTLKPESDRETVECSVESSSKLASASRPVLTRLTVTHDDAAEWQSPQTTIDDRIGVVTPIKEGSN